MFVHWLSVLSVGGQRLFLRILQAFLPAVVLLNACSSLVLVH